MKATLLRDHQGLRTFALILATDDEAMSSLAAFAAERQLKATQSAARRGLRTGADRSREVVTWNQHPGRSEMRRSHARRCRQTYAACRCCGTIAETAVWSRAPLGRVPRPRARGPFDAISA